MKVVKQLLIIHLFIFALISCTKKEEKVYSKGTLGYDIEFLQKFHKDLITLTGEDNSSQVVIAPAYQGRVMTSGSKGLDGPTFGWINYKLIESGKFQEKINVFGGEDRFWIGPEGGQYSVFFQPGVDFTFENWFTPAPIDTEPFEIQKQSNSSVTFIKDFNLENYNGKILKIGVEREISIMNSVELSQILGVDLKDLNGVGFTSENTITNLGDEPWDRNSGMPSIWILGMFQPGDNTVIFAPYENPNDSLPLVTDDYFGKVSDDRLKITEKFILFKGDGNSRGKFGLRYGVANDIIGSYSPDNNVLTLVKYSMPNEKKDYVNSLWKHQERPFEGDVVNSYNDGPLDEGGQLGPFYELESSSPAANLNPGEKLTHKHTTIHIQGDKNELNKIFQSLFGVDLNSVSF